MKRAIDELLRLAADQPVPTLTPDFDRKFRESLVRKPWFALPGLEEVLTPRWAAAFATASLALFLIVGPFLGPGSSPATNSGELVQSSVSLSQQEALKEQAENQAKAILNQIL